METKYKDILKKASLLLVDDEESLRNKFKSVLSMYVDNIYEASNGQDALDIFNKKKPQIIISDVKMPIMDGLMLTTMIRNINNNVPIVIVSGYSDRDMLLDFISLNLVEYMVKPIDFQQLNEILYKCAKAIEKNGLIEYRLNENTVYSFSKKSLIKEDEVITLTPKEVNLLELLIENKNKLVSKEQIEDIVYDMEEMSVSALNNLTSKLRKKVGANNTILTISSFGFMLADQ